MGGAGCHEGRGVHLCVSYLYPDTIDAAFKVSIIFHYISKPIYHCPPLPCGDFSFLLSHQVKTTTVRLEASSFGLV